MQNLLSSIPQKYRNKAYVTKSLSGLAAHLDTEIEGLFSFDFESIHPDNLLEWCKYHHTRFLFLEKLLELRGYTKLQNIIDKKEYTLEQENTIRHLNKLFFTKNGKKLNGSLNCFREIYNYTNKFKNLQKLSQEEIFNKLEEIKNKTYSPLILIINCAEIILENLNLSSDELTNIYKLKYNTKNIDKFRSISPWHKLIIEIAENKHRKRLDKTSAFPEDTINTHLSHEVRILTLFEKYVEKYISIPEIDKPVLQWFLETSDIKDIMKMICITSEQVNCSNERVKSQHTRHHATQFINNSLRILKFIPGLKCKTKLKSLKPSQILTCIDDKREIIDNEIRRHFHEEEITRLFQYCDNTQDLRFRLMLRILKEIGLRVSALVALKVSDVVSPDGNPREKTSVYGKGKKLRHIMFGEVLRNDIKNYLLSTDLKQDSFLFPQKGNYSKHVTTQFVRKKLNQVADRCDIHGIHVHPHAFRHTLVNKLISVGNDIHKVSKFMGHSQTSTTETYYWTSKISDIVTTMEIPWLNQYAKKDNDYDSDEDEYSDKVIAIDMFLLCVGMMTPMQLTQLKLRVPNLEDILNDFKDSSTLCGSTVASKDVTYQDFI